MDGSGDSSLVDKVIKVHFDGFGWLEGVVMEELAAEDDTRDDDGNLCIQGVLRLRRHRLRAPPERRVLRINRPHRNSVSVALELSLAPCSWR